MSSGSGSGSVSGSDQGSGVATYEGEWLEAHNGDVPEGAVEGGYDDKKETLYIARGYFKGTLLPGCLNPKDKCCYVSLDGNVGKLTTYEVLVNTDAYWKSVSGSDDIWDLPLLAGWYTEESPVIIGRVKYKDSIINGMYHCDKKVFYIVVKDKEMAFKDFEILLYSAEE